MIPDWQTTHAFLSGLLEGRHPQVVSDLSSVLNCAAWTAWRPPGVTGDTGEKPATSYPGKDSQ